MKTLVCALLAVVVAGSMAAGQQTTVGQTGLPTSGVFDSTRIDAVNLTTGELHDEILLFSIPGRGHDFWFKEEWDSNGWYYSTRCNVDGVCTDTVRQDNDSRMFGKAVSPGNYRWGASAVTGLCNAGASYVTNQWMQEPNGTKHHFVPDSCSYPIYNTSTQGSYWAYADDASGIRMYYDHTAGTNTFYDRHGDRIGSVVEDSNGNEFESDTAGRAYSNTTYQDATGTTRSIGYGTISLSTTTNFCSLDLSGNDCYETSNLGSATSSITLANGQQYTFTYATTANYPSAPDGELLSIGLPDGGTISYDWSAPLLVDGQNPGVIVTKRTLTDAAGHSYVWTYNVGSGGSTTMVDPNGNETDVNWQLLAGGLETGEMNYSSGPWPTDYYYYQGNGSSKALLKHVHYDYDSTGGMKVSAITTTLDDNEVAKVTKDYDSYTDSAEGINFTWANPLDVYEYDYGSGALLRHTQYTYLHLANTAYEPYNIADRVSGKYVYNGAGTLIAKTTYGYDETTTAGTTSVIAHDYTNFSSGFNYRGNLTSETRWVLSSNTPLTTLYRYDDAGQLQSATDPGNHATSYSYADSFTAGAPTSGITDAYPTTITYPTTSGNWQTHVETRSYSWYTGQLTVSRDQNNQATNYAYADPLFRVTRIDYPDGGAEVHNYLDSSHESQIQRRLSGGTSPDSGWSNALTFDDGLGRAVRICTANPQGSYDTVDTVWDGLNQKILESAAYSSACPAWNGSAGAGGDTMTYDGLGRETKVTHIDGSYSHTSYSGSSSQVFDETGRARVLKKDALGRLVSVCEVTPHSGSAACNNGFGATGYLTTYSYDALNDLTSVAQTANTTASRQRSFGFDSLGRLISATNPESGAISYQYNSDSLLTSKTSPLENQTGSATVTTTYSYDELHRLLSRSYNDGVTPGNNYYYDKDPDGGACTLCVGHEVKETNPRGWVKSTSFDAMGRIAAQTRLIDTTSFNSGFLYWYDGNLKQVSSPSGRSWNYGAPDVEGREVSVSFYGGGSVSRSYSLGGSSSPGMTVTDTYPGSLKSVKATNSRFQPWTNTVTNNGQTLLNLTLGYTSTCQSADNGDIATQTYTSGAVNDYCYNELNEVTSSTGYIGESWDIDPYGNRSDSYADGNNRSNGGGYAADAAGNETSIPGHTLTYLADDELHADTDMGYTYTYDGHERRFERSWSGAEVHYFYLGDSDKIIYEFPSSTPWEDYIYLGNDRVANVMESGAISYYFTDHLGSTVLMTDGSGNVLAGNWPHAYTAFGADDPHYVAPSERRRYTGKERDPESGLDYFESRYYSSAAGRFLSPDEARSDDLVDPFTGQRVFSAAGPIAFADIAEPQSLNPYAYTRNNPLRFTDPSGHCLEDACIAEGYALYEAVGVGFAAAAWLASPAGHKTMTGIGEKLGSAAIVLWNAGKNWAKEGNRLLGEAQAAADRARQAVASGAQGASAKGGSPGRVAEDAANLDAASQRVKDLLGELSESSGGKEVARLEERLRQELDKMKRHMKELEQETAQQEASGSSSGSGGTKTQ
ncbi:MAG: RHS repeat-associated core domain-containing protein [Terriglobales bacterium]